MDKFSSDFLLGAATAAHPVEGNNINSDCWAMEQMQHTSFAGQTCMAIRVTTHPMRGRPYISAIVIQKTPPVSSSVGCGRDSR